MLKKLGTVVLFLIPIFEVNNTSVLAASSKTTIYSESSYGSRFENAVIDLRLESHPLFGVENAYIGALFSQDTKSTSKDIYNENTLSLLVGYRQPLYSTYLSGFLELRSVGAFQRESSQEKTATDLRSGLIHYNLKKLNFIDESVYLETYGELIYSSRLESNIFSAIWGKLGYRQTITESLSWGPYIEPYLKRDRLGYFYENLTEFRTGLRTRFNYKNHSFQLLGYNAQGTYSDDREYKDPNPYKKSYSDWRLLFVLGGTW